MCVSQSPTSINLNMDGVEASPQEISLAFRVLFGIFLAPRVIIILFLLIAIIGEISSITILNYISYLMKVLAETVAKHLFELLLTIIIQGV